MTSDPDTAEILDHEYAKLDAMMAGLDAAVEERERAKAEATRRAREIGTQLERVGHAARLAGVPFASSTARRLYWEYPDVWVAEIAHPMNVQEGQVSRHVGPGQVERECRGGCGRTLVWQLGSRSDSARQPRLCEECAARAAEVAAERHRRWQQELASEHVDNLARLREAGTPIRRYAEFTDVPGTWAVDEDGNPLALQ